MREEDPTLFRVRVVLLVLIVACVARLLDDNPWSDGIAERLAKNAPVRPVDYADTWGWWTAAFIAPVLAALFALAPRWLAGDDPERPEHAPAPRTRAFTVLVAAAVLAGGVLALPRLSQSLFEDERYNVQWSIDGFYIADGRTGKLRFHEPSWSDTFWHYEWPNNHVPHTILARLSLSAWRALARPDHRMVNERALRLPTFLAGMASIGALGLALWRFGHPAAGVAAAWILALHPWHLRYASEARGYSLALCLLSLALVAAAGVLERGSWRRWSAFGLLQLVLLWTYAASVYYVLFLNAVLVGLVFATHRGTPALRPQLVRWLVVGLFGALVWIHMMAPNLAQFREYVKTPTQEKMDAAWFRDVGSFLVSGMPWGRARANPVFTELSDRAAAAPVLVASFVGAAVLLVVAGALRWLAVGGLRRALVPVLLIPALLSVSLALRADSHLHPQYKILALPGLVMLACLGLEGMLRPLGRRACGAGLAAAVLAFAAFTQAPRAELRSRAIQPWRDSVSLTRTDPDPVSPANEEVITVSWSFPPRYYDPRIRRVDAENLLLAMAEADRRGVPLYANIGRPALAKRRNPEIAEIVAEHFDEVAHLPGILSRGQRQVLRYRGAAD